MPDKRLARMTTEELAIVVEADKHNSSGINYARKGAHPKKDVARRAVLDLFSPAQFPDGLRMLTFPGIHWVFERQLLAIRWDHDKHTRILGIECDEAIFRGSLKYLPGLKYGLRELRTPPWASTLYAVKKTDVQYARGWFESLAADNCGPRFSGAWLDFSGPISASAMRHIGEMWDRGRILKRLVITGLRARYEAGLSDRLIDHGGLKEWALSHLSGACVLHYVEYCDVVPMWQLAVERRLF